MVDLFGQGAYDVRLDWGPVGAVATGAEVAVVVDALSFSTTVTVAVGRGMAVFPYPWREARAAEFARQHDATLAVGRLEATKDGATPAPSLSPAGLLACDPVERLVLPSPNGATIAGVLRDAGATVVIGCLRNASAVAARLDAVLREGRSVAVIASGERWASDGSLRPCLEDHLGAGAILSALRARSSGARFSPEATAAAALFDATPDLRATLHACVGGRELTEKGFAADVDVAADLDGSDVVPLLRDGAFRHYA